MCKYEFILIYRLYDFENSAENTTCKAIAIDTTYCFVDQNQETFIQYIYNKATVLTYTDNFLQIQSIILFRIRKVKDDKDLQVFIIKIESKYHIIGRIEIKPDQMVIYFRSML